MHLGYRDLQPHEIIQPEDQWYCPATNRWTPAGRNGGYTGTTVACSTLRWRRPGTWAPEPAAD